ncbi:uncharacterized protein [Malus domestica]|uniref:uncharacterized protein isoform X5 n=1 Tax=Malus domestica TaxID=3750 RepID=UPI0039752F82
MLDSSKDTAQRRHCGPEACRGKIPQIGKGNVMTKPLAYAEEWPLSKIERECLQTFVPMGHLIARHHTKLSSSLKV